MQTHYRWLILIIGVAAVAIWLLLPGTDVTLSGGDGSEDYLRLGLDLQGGIRVLLAADVPNRDLESQDMSGAKRVIENRVDALGVVEPVIQLSGDNRIIVELPGIEDQDAAIATIRETGLLEFVDFGYDPLAQGTVVSTDCWTPPDGVCLSSVSETDTADEEAEVDASTGQVYHTVLTGGGLTNAYALSPDAQQGRTEWVVALNFTDEGNTVFSEYTRTHVSQYLGIVLDGQVISAPRINSYIADANQSVIEGSFDRDSANSLAIQLRYGALPVPLKIESIERIGATLGDEAVERSVQAGLIGILVVLAFMLIYYRVPGLAADLALLLFAIINLALYRYIPVTLTLPAITGFLISVGTAVDGNILIFERLKEELRAGRPMMVAFKYGFSRALPAIMDSNISTLLICIILYFFGSQFGASAVRGFAVTLGMGLVINLFTAIIVTRTFLAIILNFSQDQIESRPWLMGV
jgi:protein-export membrane protein SecD